MKVVFLREVEVPTADGETKTFRKGRKYDLRDDAAQHHIRRQNALTEDDHKALKAAAAKEAKEAKDADDATGGGDDDGADESADNAGGGKGSA